MDQVSDSDAENSLPLLATSDVDIELLRDVYSFFSSSTRSQIRAEAKRSSFASIYDEIDSSLAENGSLSPNNWRDSESPENTTQTAPPTEPAPSTAQRSTAPPSTTPPSTTPPSTTPPSTTQPSTTQPSTEPAPPSLPSQNSHVNTSSSQSITGGNHSQTTGPTNLQSIQHVTDTPANETPNAVSAPTSSRSLRKRTFSSRHPYIADQADWLGICTVDSINEMFSEHDNITQVCKALNQLYLQKRKRFPDEDRYRSKNFYAHLGNSKMLALSGDVDEDQDLDHAEKQTQDESQNAEFQAEEVSENEEEMIPYDGFEIPYSQDNGSSHAYVDDNDILRTIDEGVDYDDIYEPYNKRTHVNSDDSQNSDDNAQNSDDSQNSDENSQISDADDSQNSEAEESLIRIGGRYRKLSTILRGVLPESAKRLDVFKKVAPRKKRKVARVLPPRKGLAIRKVGTAPHQSSDLEKELSSLAEKDIEPVRSPSPDQTMLNLSISRSDKFNNRDTIPQVPMLRTASSFGYRSETPDSTPIAISSGSDNDSDIETVFPEKLSAITPGYQRSLPQEAVPFENYAFDDDEVQEVDTIDRLLSNRRDNSEKKVTGRKSRIDQVPNSIKSFGQREPNFSGHREPNFPGQREPKFPGQREPKFPGQRESKFQGQRHQRKYQRRLGTSRIVSGRPSRSRPQGQPRMMPGTTRRQTSKIAKVFGQRPQVQSVLFPKQSETTPRKQNETKKKERQEFAIHSHSNFFRRDPVVATSVYEVEESDAPQERQRPAIKSVNPQLFVPSKESLSSDRSLSSLIGTTDIIKASAIEGGQIFFRHVDSVSFSFLEKHFEFARINPLDSAKNLVRFFALCRRSLTSDLVPDSPARAQLQDALKHVIRWLFVNKERPSEQMWKQLRMTMEHFSKLQTKHVRRSQSILHSQLLYIFWIFIKLEVTAERIFNPHRASALETKLSHDLDKYASDFWITVFQTFSGAEFIGHSADADHLSSVFLIQAIYENQDESWWPPMTEALRIVLEIGDLDSRPLNILLALASMVKREHYSWAPVLAVLHQFKSQNHSRGLHYFMDTCTLLKRRLSWPLEEKIILQLYGQFAARKFANFPDESDVPLPLGLVRSWSDIPESSVFERFMGFTYDYLSEMSSIKEAKKLISKLLATSQYHYFKGKKSQIMFVNRINLIVLFSQISEIDLGNQYLNLVQQVKDSNDAFVYGRSLDALQVLCEVSKRKERPIPLQAFRLMFSIFDRAVSFPGLHELYKRFLSHIGFVFQGTESKTKSGIFELFEILGELDMSKVSDDFKLDLLGIAFLSTQELSSAQVHDIIAKQRSALTKFNDTLLRFTSTQMSRLPIAPMEADEFLEELIEFSLEIWIITSKLLDMCHWNIMMLQKFSYAGNSISRNRFIMFFCTEYLNHCPINQTFLLEIDKILLLGMLSPQLSKYALDLYVHLNKNSCSIFCLKSIQDINSVFALQTYRLPIISRIIYNIGTSNVVNGHERDALVLDFVKRLHEEYSQHFQDASYSEMGKKIMEQVGKYARTSVNDSDEFWELSAKLGLPNKWMHDNWRKSDDTQKVYLLNREFLCALAGEEHSYVNAIDNWIDVDNNHVLYALIQVYCSALTFSDRYWGHVSLLLVAFLHKLKRFQIAIRERAFGEFLMSLVELAVFSRRKPSQYLAHELHALSTCASIFEQTMLFYDGYKDISEVQDLIDRFTAGYKSKPPKQFKIVVTFTDITVEKIRQYQTVHSPKLLREPDDMDKALQESDAMISRLANMNRKGDVEMPDFSFDF